VPCLGCSPTGCVPKHVFWPKPRRIIFKQGSALRLRWRRRSGTERAPRPTRPLICSFARGTGGSRRASPSSRSCCGEANLAFKPKAIAATLAA
jgi:hypothetical protein